MQNILEVLDHYLGNLMDSHETLEEKLAKTEQSLLDFQKAQANDSTKLEREYQELKEENKRLDSERLVSDNKNLQNELARLLNDNNALVITASKLRNEVRELKEENERIGESWENQDVVKLRRENDQIGENLETVASSLREKTQLVKCLESEIQARDTEITRLRVENERLEISWDSQNLERMNGVIKKLAEEKLQLTGDVGERDRKIHMLKLELAGLTKTHEELVGKITSPGSMLNPDQGWHDQ
jgi:chromosome segregation ATPase